MVSSAACYPCSLIASRYTHRGRPVLNKTQRWRTLPIALVAEVNLHLAALLPVSCSSLNLLLHLGIAGNLLALARLNARVLHAEVLCGHLPDRPRKREAASASVADHVPRDAELGAHGHAQ